MKYEEVVIGSSLEALFFAYQRGLPIIYTKPEKPFRFDFFDEETQFPELGIDNIKTTLRTNLGDITVGCRKENVWERMYFLLSIGGLIPFSNLANSIRKTDEGAIVMNEYGKILLVEFDKCYYFWDDGSTGFVSQTELVEEYYVYDWLSINKGGQVIYDKLYFDREFCKEIWFYPSERPKVSKSFKDLCAVSEMTFDQLSDFDFTETMVAFQIKKDFKETMGRPTPKLSQGPRIIVPKNKPKIFPADEKIVICENIKDYHFPYREEFQLYLRGYKNAYSRNSSNK